MSAHLIKKEEEEKQKASFLTWSESMAPPNWEYWEVSAVGATRESSDGGWSVDSRSGLRDRP